MMVAETAAHGGVDRFVLLYALAWAGGTIAYVPLLTILLPHRIVDLAGPVVGVQWQAAIVLAGAVAASLGAIAFGWLSDISRNRRGWIVAGLLLSGLLLSAIWRAESLMWLIILIGLWQLALNMMLAPLAAWAGDRVPDHRKGILGGLMAFAPGVGALAAVLVTQPGLASGSERLLLIALLVAACVLPAILFTPTGPAVGAPVPGDHGHLAGHRAGRGVVVQMWLARLAVQIAEATLFAYLFFWLRSLDPAFSDNQTARLFSFVLLVSAPLAVLAGRWSDRHDRPMAPLCLSALAAAVGLLAMALAPGLAFAIAGYCLFGVASAMFLALHAAQTLRILPDPARRGRDLGLFNLANTIPSLIMPGLAILIIPQHGFSALFMLLAGLGAGASLMLARIARHV